MIGKLLGAASVGSTLAGIGLLHRFLSDVASIIFLAIVSAFMLCAVLTGCIYMVYLYLVRSGLDPYAAGVTIGIVALLVATLFVVLTIGQIRQLRELPYRGLHRYKSGLSDVGHVADAFIDGFLNPRK
jgi:hypothetical protein